MNMTKEESRAYYAEYRRKNALMDKCCGGCIFFLYEDIYGNGFCSLNYTEKNIKDKCKKYRSNE